MHRRREDDGARAGARRVHAAHDVEPIEPRRIVIEEQHIGPQAGDHVDRGIAVAGLADDHESRLLREQRPDAQPEDRMVVGDGNPDA